MNNTQHGTVIVNDPLNHKTREVPDLLNLPEIQSIKPE